MVRIDENIASGREAFMASHTLQDAVIRNLQTLAESTQRLSTEIKATQPHIDWRAIAAFRNVLVHDYLGLDLGQIWSVIHQDIPLLKEAVQTMEGSCSSPPGYGE
ncbi:HepT-like ribonuclease domain-containing protein [Endothiovibrio diazotrophicus]